MVSVETVAIDGLIWMLRGGDAAAGVRVDCAFLDRDIYVSFH